MSEIVTPSAEGAFRQTVDPLQGLPYIELWASGERQLHPAAVNYRIMEETGDVGYMTIVAGGAEQYIARLSLSVEPHRKYRVGTAVLTIAAEHAHKEGADLRTDPAGEYLDHVLLWQAMVDRGAARVITPFVKRPLRPWHVMPLVHRGGYITLPQILPGTVPVELTPPDGL